MEQTQRELSRVVQEEEKPVGIRELMQKYLYHWKFFVISLVSCGVLAVLYIIYGAPTYYIHAKLLVETSQSPASGGVLDAQSLLTQLGLSPGNSNVSDELEVLNAHTILNELAHDMKLNVLYYGKAFPRKSEIYKANPFTCRVDSLSANEYNFPLDFDVHIKPSGVYISAKDTAGFVKYGNAITIKGTRFTVLKTDFLPDPNFNYYHVQIMSYEDAIERYYKKLNIKNPDPKIDVIYIDMSEEVPSKGTEVLNKMIETYINSDIEDKNKIADSTIEFINGRLAGVTDILTNIEKTIENFKTRNKLVDLTQQSQLLVTNSSDYVKQYSNQQVQLQIITELEKYLRDEKNNKRIVPSSLIVQNDANFDNLITTYNTLQLQKERESIISTDVNPTIQGLDQQISRVRTDILNNLLVTKRNLTIAVDETQKKIASLDAQVSGVPAKEREFIDYSRQREIQNQLYIFLLTKREETAIGKASNLDPVRIVDAAYSDSLPTWPNKILLIALAFILGLGIPMLTLYLKSLFNRRILERKDIEDKVHVPILGEISMNTSKERNIISAESRTAVSEQIRALRTNLDFVIGNKEGCKTIMITSSMGNEGKSFISMNLSLALALSGKKVVLLEFDLRKPKVLSSLDLKASKGISNYIIFNDLKSKDLLIPSGLNVNFFLIGAGLIPPNPVEMIINKRVDELIEELKLEFDYIIIDTPPIGIVTDAQLLSRFADTTLYLIRQGVTFKNQTNIPEDLYINQKIKNLAIVVNGIKTSGKYGYGYGYGYGYSSYGYGYLDGTPRKKGIFSRIFRRKRAKV